MADNINHAVRLVHVITTLRDDGLSCSKVIHVSYGVMYKD